MKRMTKVALGVGAMALAGGGVSYAAIPDSGTGVYTMCLPNAGTYKAPVFIDKESGASCQYGYSEKTFNQTGPTGPQGATGPEIQSGTLLKSLDGAYYNSDLIGRLTIASVGNDWEIGGVMKDGSTAPRLASVPGPTRADAIDGMRALSKKIDPLGELRNCHNCDPIFYGSNSEDAILGESVKSIYVSGSGSSWTVYVTADTVSGAQAIQGATGLSTELYATNAAQARAVYYSVLDVQDYLT